LLWWASWEICQAQRQQVVIDALAAAKAIPASHLLNAALIARIAVGSAVGSQRNQW